MLNDSSAECHKYALYAEYRYAECSNAGSRAANMLAPTLLVNISVG